MDRPTKKPTTSQRAIDFESALSVARRHFGRGFGARSEDPGRATIEIDGERYVLVRAASMSMDFVEAVTRLYGQGMATEGLEVARSLQFDRAHALGLSDARRVHEALGLGEPLERMFVGAPHFAHMGWAVVQMLPESRPLPDDRFLLVYDHAHSFEADAWLRAGKRADFPVCLMSAGYSSGWCEQSFGVPLVSVEVRCRAQGDDCCRFVMALPGSIEEHVRAQLGSSVEGRRAARRCHIPGLFQTKDQGPILERLRAEMTRTVQLGVEELRRANRALEEEVVTRRMAEAALTRRVEAEHLVASVTKQFIRVGPDTFDVEVDAMLGTVGEFVGADRAYLFQLRSGGAIKDNTHEWCAPGIAPEIGRLQGLPVHDFPLWMEPLGRLEDVLIPSVEEIPEVARNERRHLQEQGIQSMLLVPVSAAGTLVGFIGFDAVREARDWRLADATLLRMIGDALASAIDRIRSEQTLRETEAKLRQSHKLEAVGRLAGGVAHDFNNLLAVIQGNADFLVDALPEGDPRRADAQDILVAADRGARLTAQLLAFGRRQPLAHVVLDINGIVRDVETMLARLLGEHIALEMRLDPALRPVLGDAHQLELVVMNLALNARDAMPEGGRLLIQTRNEPPADAVPQSTRAAADHGEVVLAVTDDGVGMDEETKLRVFEPFFTTKEVGRGTGLGLATVHGIVSQASGTITVESTPGVGTTFEVRLPAVLDAMRAASIHPPSLAPDAAGETILVVEDEDAVRRATCRMLEARGYEVLEAADGDQAKAIAARHIGPIDLLLTDVVMPGMAGPEVHRQVRAERPTIRVVYMSGYPKDMLDAEGRVPSCAALIAKPFGAEELARLVRTVLDGLA